MMATRDVSAALRKVKMPPDVLTVGSGDPDELSEYIAQVGHLAATCATTDRQISSTELAVIAYEYGWTRRQKDVAADVLKMNDVWKEIGA